MDLEKLEHDPVVCFTRLQYLAEKRISNLENCAIACWRLSNLPRPRALELLNKKAELLRKDMSALYRARAETADEFTLHLIDDCIALLPLQIEAVEHALEDVAESPFDTAETSTLYEGADGNLCIKSTHLSDLWHGEDDAEDGGKEHRKFVCSALGMTAEQIEQTLSQCTPEGYAELKEVKENG